MKFQKNTIIYAVLISALHSVSLAANLRSSNISSRQLQDTSCNDDSLVVCGSRFRINDCGGQESKIVSKQSRQAVRCCSETPLSGWVKNPLCNVFGESDINGQCYDSVTFEEAVDICALSGARLCTPEEIRLDCTQGSGCDFDGKFTWTFPSTPGDRDAPDTCAQISGTEGSGDGRIDLQQDGATNSWVSINPLPVLTAEYKIKNIQVDVLQCEGANEGATTAPTCSWRVKLAYCEKDGACNSSDPTYRVGTFFASGQGPEPYRITDGTGDFQNVGGTIDSVFDFRNTRNLQNIDIQLCYKETIVCGSRREVNRSCGRQESLSVSKDTKHAVRCCSDEFKPGWLQVSGCEVWAESDPVPGQCLEDATFDEAVQFCSDAGARLCTADEIRSDCTTTTGCDFDFELVWSAPDPKKAFAVCGARFQVESGVCGKESEYVSKESKQAVRCCSDTSKPGWVKSTECPVWGESDLPGCFGEATFDEAVDICAAAGARLCTRDELRLDCTKNSGCGHDSRFVWSSTVV